MLFKAGRFLLGQPLQKEVTAAYVTAFRRHRAQAVLAEYGDTGTLSMDACKLLGIPLIVHFHGYDASVHSVLAEHRVTYPIMFRRATALIAVSKAMKQKLCALGAPAEKVFYNPYGIDCSKFTGSHPSSNPATFLAVGRFVEKKAPHLTLTAFAGVFEKNRAARLRMIGDGPLLEQSKKLTRDLGIDQAVTFLGAQAPAIVQAEMRNARCFVQHSVEAPSGDSEGTPVGILEAEASGLPVVATRHAGIPDVVIEGETGFLVAEGDVTGMAERMLRFCAEPQLADKMGNAARHLVLNSFRRETSLARLWAIIEGCILGKAMDAHSFS